MLLCHRWYCNLWTKITTNMHIFEMQSISCDWSNQSETLKTPKHNQYAHFNIDFDLGNTRYRILNYSYLVCFGGIINNSSKYFSSSWNKLNFIFMRRYFFCSVYRRTQRQDLWRCYRDLYVDNPFQMSKTLKYCCYSRGSRYSTIFISYTSYRMENMKADSISYLNPICPLIISWKLP